MIDFWVQQQAGVLLFLCIALLIAASNLMTLRRLNEYGMPTTFPRISVLVPARNEEANIGPCVRSLLAQQYPDFQVLVLDDHSEDGTARVLAELAQDTRLQVMKGRPLPDGWLGKHWACHQLAQAADGELLLFTDADTRHHSQTLSDTVSALLIEQADLLTAIPRQKTVTWGEQLIVPIMPWSILSFVPVALAYRLKMPLLSATIGQFMLFRRQAYEQIGGHASARQHAADDLALGRKVKACGLRWRLVDGNQRIQCRMYHNFQEAFEGFSKNLFAAFDYNAPLFLFVWLWLGLVFWGPFIMLTGALAGMSVSTLALTLATANIIGSLILWGITCSRFGFPLYLVFLYPIGVFLAMTIALRSMALTLTGGATWKGRPLPVQRAH